MGFFMGFYGILLPWEYSFPLWFFLYFHPGISEFRSLYTLGFSKLHPVTPWVYKIPIMGIRDSSSAVIPTLVFSFSPPYSSCMVRLYSTMNFHPGFYNVPYSFTAVPFDPPCTLPFCVPSWPVTLCNKHNIHITH